jgi:exonuclease III
MPRPWRPCSPRVHPKYQDDGRPGTFGNGTKSQKIDYILLSPELFDKVENAEVFRKGVWGGKNGDLFEHFPEMMKPVHAASDHAALFVDLNI